MNEFLLVIFGLLAGAFSGLIGLGGGVIIVPALVFIFGMSQLQAQGTTLALLVPPIGILAAWTYYKEGLVDLKGCVLGSSWVVLWERESRPVYPMTSCRGSLVLLCSPLVSR